MTWHTPEVIRRLVAEILREEITAATRRHLPDADVQSWRPELTMDEEGIGFDSLSRLEAATHLSQFFHLHEVGLEDRLLMDRTLERWLAIVDRSLSVKSERLTFRTSGSTGTPKPCVHEISALVEEAEAFASILSPQGRIVSLLPPHHLFGFIFTVLLPAVTKAPLFDARAYQVGLVQRLKPQDVIVATPFHWAMIEKTVTSFPQGAIAISSTAPLPADLRARLAAKGMSRIIEIYGSSETAGIGWRDAGGGSYRLLPYLEKAGTGIIRIGRDGRPSGYLAPQDHIVWRGEREIEPMGRTDGAVKIGGINVFPDLIAQRLASHPSVRDCVVRVRRGPNPESARLEAEIVASDADADEHRLVADLVQYCAAEFAPAERPASFALVRDLQRTSMGKIRSA